MALPPTPPSPGGGGVHAGRPAKGGRDTLFHATLAQPGRGCARVPGRPPKAARAGGPAAGNEQATHPRPAAAVSACAS